MTGATRLASVSMDLDNVWSYLKTHGDDGWELRPSYLATFVPYLLDLLEQEQLKITFFVVGADAAIPEHGPVLQSLVQHGHELGNHSFEHDPWMARYDRSRIEDEIARTEAAILASTGRRPIGFRGPGYAWSGELLEIRSERGYLYDAPERGRAKGARAAIWPARRWIASRRRVQLEAAQRPYAARAAGDDVSRHQDPVSPQLPDVHQPVLRTADGGVPRRRATRVPPFRHRAELPAPSARSDRREAGAAIGVLPGHGRAGAAEGRAVPAGHSHPSRAFHHREHEYARSFTARSQQSVGSFIRRVRSSRLGSGVTSYVRDRCHGAAGWHLSGPAAARSHGGGAGPSGTRR